MQKLIVLIFLQQPASSGRIAELVSSQNVTFDSLASGAAGAAATFVPIIPDAEDTGLDPQLSLTLRKLGKKDPTTKIKVGMHTISILVLRNIYKNKRSVI